jgi:hypothetical protein
VASRAGSSATRPLLAGRPRWGSSDDPERDLLSTNRHRGDALPPVATDSPEPLYVDASDALRAVIMGYECAPGFFPALAELCVEQDVKIRALHWFNVGPHLVGIAINHR